MQKVQHVFIQLKVDEIIGAAATEGIPGAENCDTSLDLVNVNNTAILSSCSVAVTSTRREILPATPSNTEVPPIKRPKLTPKQVQLKQNEEMLQNESGMRKAVEEIRTEISGMRADIGGIASALNGIHFELKRSNDLKERQYYPQQNEATLTELASVNPINAYFNN